MATLPLGLNEEVPGEVGQALSLRRVFNPPGRRQDNAANRCCLTQLLGAFLFALFFCPATAFAASPVEFGMAELKSALDARKLKTKFTVDLSTEAPETYRIETYKAGGAHISGGDLRGLMYGLLEAADQIRDKGRLTQVHGIPAANLRGVRAILRVSDVESPWYRSQDFWRGYIQMLARNRFNRLNLVFVSRSSELERPYGMLRFISQTATEYGIDFALGIWDPSVLIDWHSEEPDSEALSRLLAACPMIRTIQILPDGNLGDSDHTLEFYRGTVLQPLREAGRRVAIDLRAGPFQPGLIKAATDLGLALRVVSPSPAGDSAANGAEQAPHPIYWELTAGDSASDPNAVGNAISAITLGGSSGFEIEVPSLNPALQQDSLFYWLWGRLSYDPKTKPPTTIP